jgi:hypothetical protein
MEFPLTVKSQEDFDGLITDRLERESRPEKQSLGRRPPKPRRGRG